jgi:hypothetical protein
MVLSKACPSLPFKYLEKGTCGPIHSKRFQYLTRKHIRWIDDVESDLKKMKVKGWKEKMRNREQWRLFVEEAKTHPGCSAEWKEGRKEGRNEGTKEGTRKHM